eukprot:289136-Amphidinium_carterae.1
MSRSFCFQPSQGSDATWGQKYCFNLSQVEGVSPVNAKQEDCGKSAPTRFYLNVSRTIGERKASRRTP